MEASRSESQAPTAGTPTPPHPLQSIRQQYLTYILTNEGWLYLAIVLDLCTRKVVGWAMRDHLRQEFAIAALTMVIQPQKPGRGLIPHFDRGSQYAAHDYQKLLKANGILALMSRKGNCWDNAPMESWFRRCCQCRRRAERCPSLAQ
jgi:transposase InsO family protein